MNIIKAVLFDLDGTLVDTAPDFITTVNILLEQENKAPLAAEEIRRTVSNGARALIYLAFGLSPGEAGFDDLLKRLLDIYSQRLAIDTCLFPGIDSTLNFLSEKQLPWGIVTNKSITYTQPILDALNITPPPQSVICPDHVTNTKPDPEPLLLACQQLRCSPQEIIYVGDHIRDIDCGKRAGSITVAVSYGYIDENDDPKEWQADYLIDHATELQAVIEKHL